MSLIVDRDLLVLESSLFVDAAGVGTVLASGADGAMSGTSLLSVAVSFGALGVTEGHVATVAGDALEVVSLPSTNTLMVSRPRMNADEPAIPPAPGTSLEFTVTTFERQIAEAEAWALGALGIDPHDAVKPLTVEAVVNTDELARLVALRTICDVFAMQAARDDEETSAGLRRDLYRSMLRRAVGRTSILLDLNGDGVPDASRRLSTIVLERS
jgi:hypothetical protein